ncbi:hypothetical protein CTAYLR_006752 [Chrysophaeum taylorii]|uniref:UmuC domain-containing protein n=1 Tax=Chrysophaeum taylorii TaxID=2483200 RepID=A0AAD7XKQ6_9STRA|nr:hypothetical protein CTAYLR_006752 [Chrysophaeum taylorii]
MDDDDDEQAAITEAKAQIAEQRRGEKLLQMGKRTTREDPEYLSTFFKASRLHFIGAWRERWHEILDGREEEEEEDDESPERVIFHVDLDCFFASVATRDKPELRKVPVAVCWGDGAKASTSEISSANYKAREFGVRAGMFLGEARKMCPSLVTIPFEFEKYAEAAAAAFGRVLDATPRVVGLSIDECVADVSRAVRAADVASVAASLRKAIENATGCTASIGSAKNRMLAKIATSFAKPDGHFHLAFEDAEDLLRTMPVSTLPSIGPKRSRDLAAVGIETCGDLAADRPKLEATLGAKLAGEALKNARGIDDRPWEPRPPRKSVSAQCSYGVRCGDEADASRLIDRLVDEVAVRAKRLLPPSAGLKGCGIKIWRSKTGADQSSCKSGVGHGLCDVLTRVAPFSDQQHQTTTTVEALDDRARALAARLFKDAAIAPADVRGLGVFFTLAKPPDPDPSQVKITTLFQQQQQQQQQNPRKRRRYERPPVVVPVGLPGCGKSTFFAEYLEPLGVVRACQDLLRRREAVKFVVDKHAARRRRPVFVDRTNYDRDQRADWVAIAKARGVPCVALVFDATPATCAARARARVAHEGRLDRSNPAQCDRVVRIINQRLRPVADDEGFDRVIHLQQDADADVKRRIAQDLAPPQQQQPPPPPPLTVVTTTGRDQTVPPPPKQQQPPPIPATDHPQEEATTTTSEGAWTCRACTFLNRNPTFLCCEICQTTRE